MLSDQDVGELEHAAARAAAPIAQAAADWAMQEAGLGPSAPGGGGGGGGGGNGNGNDGGGGGGQDAAAAEESPAASPAGAQGATTAFAPVKAFIEPEKGDN